MDKRLLGVFSFAIFLIAIFTAGLLILNSSRTQTAKLEDSIVKLTEAAYFEGQKDAIEGDVRIKKTEAGWVWEKSPWDNGQVPIYDPSVGLKGE